MSTNLVVVTGRLGKEPEVRTTPGGKSVCSFSLAVDEGYGDKKKTLWLNCEAWDKTAEALSRMVSQGKRVTVVGSLKEETWNDTKTGEKRSRMKVLAQRVDIIDFADKSQGDGNGEDNDIPF